MGELRFLLNDAEIALSEVGSRDTLLDFLRLSRRLTGTKEGCAEGDCGACTVLVGRLAGGELLYEPVNACIRPLASCHAVHIVTIEHLRGDGGGLHPVQQAMVDHHASQCGFCTPGIVMALYALWMRSPHPSDAQIETALQGNLCRCTGYEPIIRAARAAAKAGGQDSDILEAERGRVSRFLRDVPRERLDLRRGEDRAIIPADADDFAQIYAQTPGATVVAGATDVGLWVTKFLRDISPAIFINHLMKEITETDVEIRLGAGVTYAEAGPAMARALPQIADYWLRIGGWQVRAMGTIGGNIANGSPIGDSPPLLIALGARIVLRRGDERREIALEDFFIEYGKQDRAEGEFVEEIIIPRPQDAQIAAYKVSKRAHSDITSVAACFLIRREGGKITEARLAYGGMAGTPKRAAKAEAALLGQSFTEASFEAAARAASDDFDPMTDMRASREYRTAVASNLLRRFWLEQSGEDARLTRLAEDCT
ncbi:MAG: xanthine dehydrogenase small subunit [Paracoccus sp. (in: a-proteobacteria)]|nr:xanthine dehydrogenase small subunit [Paracoccus sp. (in: a-proteobacteria)]